MNCFCESGKTYELKIEGDVGADPFWCDICGCNLNTEDVPISGELAEELSSWAMNYGEWIDWEKDRLLSNGLEMEDDFNRIGVALKKKVLQEIGDIYNVKYSPAKSTSFY